MTPILAPDCLATEVAVVILEPLYRFPWLREHRWSAPGPTARPERIPGYRVVAYSTARPRRYVDLYPRRVWFVRSRDHLDYGDRDWPVEAVDPASIAPRRASRSMGVPPWRHATVPGDHPGSELEGPLVGCT